MEGGLSSSDERSIQSDQTQFQNNNTAQQSASICHYYTQAGSDGGVR